MSWFLFNLIFSVPILVQAQALNPTLGEITLSSYGGFILAPQKSTKHLENYHVWGAQLRAELPWLLNEKWVSRYKKLNAGAALLYVNHGAYQTLGETFGLSPYVELGFYNKPKFEINGIFTMGLVWHNRPFDKIDNIANLALGNSFSALLQGSLEAKYLLTEQVNLRVGLGLIHYSNGSYRMPNFGLNMPVLSLGVGIMPFPNQIKAKEKLFYSDTLKPYWSLSWLGNTGVVENFPTNGPLFPYYSTGLFLGRRLSYKSMLNFGLEYMLNTSLSDLPWKEEALAEAPPERFGLYMGHELFFGAVSFSAGTGVYIYKPLNVHLPVYQRVGLRYWIGEELFLAGNVKLHGFSAEVIELGFGYSLNFKKE